METPDKNIFPGQGKVANRIFAIVLNRVLDRGYEKLEEESQKIVERVFSLGGEQEKKEAIEKYFPDIKSLFEEEIKVVEKELLEELEKQKGS